MVARGSFAQLPKKFIKDWFHAGERLRKEPDLPDTLAGFHKLSLTTLIKIPAKKVITEPITPTSSCEHGILNLFHS